MGIVKSLFARSEAKREEITEAAVPPRPETARLVMLMPDAAGIATYHQHTFADAGQAVAYLDQTLRGDLRSGTIMFWALTWFPPEKAGCDDIVEPVVLIRDLRQADLVYTFSFADVDSAYAFVRHEMTAGLDLAQVAVFWAAPAKASVDFWGQVSVTPAEPPTRSAANAIPQFDLVDETDAEEAHDFPPPELKVIAPTAEEERARRLIDQVDVSNIVRILEAKGLRAPANLPRPADEETEDARDDEPELGDASADEVACEPEAEENGHYDSESDDGSFVAEPEPEGDVNGNGSHEANGVKPVEDETMHVQLSDVFGKPMRVVRRTDPEALINLGDFGGEEEEGDAPFGNGTNGHENGNGAEAMTDEAAGGVTGAWANIALAIDEAIDAYIARKVIATIVWRRLSRALAAGARARMGVAWRRLSKAITAAATLQVDRERAMVFAWQNLARALSKAAEAQSGRRGLRLAWLNISWTLEEAVYAARLEHKRIANEAWFTLSVALHDAAAQKDAIERGVRTAWALMGRGVAEAAAARESQRTMVIEAWMATGEAFAEAVEEKHRFERVVFAWESAGEALGSAVEVKLRHDGLVAAWTRLSAAIEAVAGAQMRQRGVVRAWRVLALEMLMAADMQVKREIAVRMWTNGTRALAAGVAERLRIEGLVSAWYNAARALRNAAQALAVRQMSYQQSWLRLSAALADAAGARARLEAAIAAWHNVTAAIVEAVGAKVRHDRCVAIWDALAVAIGEVLAVERKRLGAIEAWGNAMIALGEAAVAEAQLRIAHAGLDDRAMKSVARAIREAKGRKTASAAGKAADTAIKVARGAAVAVAEAEVIEPVGAEEAPKPAQKNAKRNGRTEKMSVREEAIEDKKEDEAPAEQPATEVTEKEKAAAMELWRFRENGRFSTKEQPFEGFESPPGRF